MNWVAEKLGAADYVEPTQGTTQRLAVAIRVLSENIVQRHVRANTGWIEHEGQDVFLHAGGALGADGPVTGVVVELPGTLDAFELPDPPDRNQLRKSVTFSLFIRRAMADRVAAALLGAVFRAPLGEADLAVHLAGHTGTGKSELASLAQRHFGKSMHSRALPCAWSSTANYLEATASAAKDVLLTVDDFIPQGTPNERARWDALADRLIRAQGNRSGRGRLNSGGAARKIRPPRGLVLSTGEEVPAGQSLRARMAVVWLSSKDIKFEMLSLLQRQAADGVYAEAMAGYIMWLAGGLEEARDRFRGEVADLRELFSAVGHKRTADVMAQLLAACPGARWLRFAVAVGA